MKIGQFLDQKGGRGLGRGKLGKRGGKGGKMRGREECLFSMGSCLFSHTRDKFGTGSGIIIPTPPRPNYILKIFLLLFYLIL